MLDCLHLLGSCAAPLHMQGPVSDSGSASVSKGWGPASAVYIMQHVLERWESLSRAHKSHRKGSARTREERSKQAMDRVQEYTLDTHRLTRELLNRERSGIATICYHWNPG